MVENNKPAPLEVIVGKRHYEVTNMAGCTVASLKRICATNGIAIPENTDICVFTIEEPATGNPAVLERTDAILTREHSGALQILQGLTLKVGDDYVFSPGDVSAEFRPR